MLYVRSKDFDLEENPPEKSRRQNYVPGIAPG